MKRARKSAGLVLIAATAGMLAGCAAADDHRERVSAYVIGPSPDGEHDVVVCEDGAGESDPPTCAGTPLVGWDWDAVPHDVSQTDPPVRSGFYHLEFTRLQDGGVAVDMSSVRTGER